MARAPQSETIAVGGDRDSLNAVEDTAKVT